MLDPEKCVEAPISIVDHFLEKSIVWLNSGQIDLSASALFACLKVSSLSPNASKERPRLFDRQIAGNSSLTKAD